jgi:hypothetical protein
MMKSQIPGRTASIGKLNEYQSTHPMIRPHQIATYLIKGELLKAALLRSCELKSK